MADPLPITVPFPRVLPKLYSVPSAGIADKEEKVLCTIRYSSTLDTAAKEPFMLEDVILLKLNPVGCADGVVQGS